jgi:elongation factor Ts
MQVSTEAIKTLRAQTSAGIMECKRALQESGGDISAAAAALTERGYAIAKKKANRLAEQGLVEAYVHTGGRLGALVEINCESDFVARTPEFKELAHDLAMQVAAVGARFVSAEDVPEGEEFAEEDCLLLQPFIKDPDRKVADLVADAIAKVRENVQVRRFVRFELGANGEHE